MPADGPPPPVRTAAGGTSQRERTSAALSPEHVLVDERDDAALLRLGRGQARLLRWFDADDTPDGTWTGLLPDEVDLDRLAAALTDPASATGPEAARLARPHLALYLTFLRLLGHLRDDVNAFPRRHLDFFYRNVLGLTERPARPDSVNVVLGLAAGADPVALPAGSLLAAGTDEQQRDRRYATDREIVVTRASVAELRSLYLVQQVTTLDDLGLDGRPQSVLRMLGLVLADPDPDPDAVLPALQGQPVDLDRLRTLDALIRTSVDVAHLSLPQLRVLVRLKRQRDAEDPPAWSRITRILTAVATRRDPAFPGGLSEDPAAFEHNLDTAVGGPPDYRELPQVTGFDDLYALRADPAVTDFVTRRLGFAMDEFVELSQLKRTSDAAWAQINAILDAAGKAADPTFDLAARPGFQPRAFDDNAAAALHGFRPVEFWTGMEDLEAYFSMSVESVQFLTTAASRPDGPTAAEWTTLRSLLTTAYRARLTATVPGRLDALRGDGTTGQHAALAAMVRLVLGARAPRDLTLEGLLALLPLADQRMLEPLAIRASRDQLTAADWAQAQAALGDLLRAQVAVAIPVAHLWERLRALPVASTAVPAPVGGFEPGTPRWRTFGQADAPDASAPPVPLIGFAVSSPTLATAGGARTLTVTLGLVAETFSIDPAQLDGALVVEVSTAAGWVRPASAAFTTVPYPEERSPTGAPALTGLRVTAVLAPDADAVAAVVDPASPWPSAAMRLMLAPTPDPATGQWRTPQQPALARTVVAAVRVAAQVDPPGGDAPGLPGLVARNDEGPLDPTAPFEPFGATPVVGSTLRVGAPELLVKRLDRVTLALEWLGAPADLETTYYNGYDPNGPTTSRPVTATLGLARRGTTTVGAGLPLFTGADARLPVSLTADVTDPGPGASPARSAAPAASTDSLDPAVVQLELDTRDFLHAQYPTVLTRKAMQFAAAMSRPGGVPDTAGFTVNPPYTPKLKRLGLGYSASSSLDLRASGVAGAPAGTSPTAAPRPASADRLWHIHPFGRAELPVDDGSVPLLPAYDNAGELYIGLADVDPPQSVAILFQVGEGSADPDLPAPQLDWSYLSGEGWVPLPSGALVSDSTQSFLNSGIVEIALPAAAPSPLLPPARFWLRAAIAADTRAVCDMIGVHAQAVPATYVGDGSGGRADTPLPAGTVTGLQDPVPSIATVSQPYSSFGGAAAEATDAFDRRVSERLRHRDRAVTAWDYERLVLEQFPDIYRAKCLAGETGDAGHVDVVVLPDIRNRNPFNPFEPKVPADRLRAIQAFLGDRISPAARLRVRNARFLSIRVRVDVRFRSGVDVGFSVRRLSSDLDRFLSPWAFDDAADIVIGGQIWADSIVGYVDGRGYVDHVDGVELLAKDDASPFWLPLRTTVATQAPDTVMVSAGSHEIVVLADEQDQGERWTGIGYMAVQIDFTVG